MERLLIQQGALGGLDGLYFYLLRGERLGILYDNLQDMNALKDFFYGQCPLTDGSAYFDGRRIPPADGMRFLPRHVAVIERRSVLFRHLTVEENLFLNLQNRHALLRRRIDRKMYRRLLDRFHIDAVLDDRAGEISPLDRKRLELLQAFVNEKTLVVVVNLSGTLSEEDSRAMMTVVDEMAARGFSFIFLDNSIPFLLRHTDRLTALQRGTNPFFSRTSLWEEDGLGRMFFQPSKAASPAAGGFPAAAPCVEFCQLSSRRLRGVDWSIGRGQIVSLLCGSDEDYQHIRDLFYRGGAITQGELRIGGQPYANDDLSRAVRQGVAVIDENPIHSSLFQNKTVAENCKIALLQKISTQAVGQRFSRSIDSRLSAFFSERELRLPASRLPLDQQQRLVYCRWLLYLPQLLICLKPFSSIDIKMISATREMLQLCAANGSAVLIVTTSREDLAQVPSVNYWMSRKQILPLI